MNLVGAARTVEMVVPRMLNASAGHIVGVSSLADTTTSGQALGYNASKAGLSIYLRGLTLALREYGLTVATVRIGFVDTKMAKADREPAKMSVYQAVDLLVDAIATRPAVVSRPRRTALAMRLLDCRHDGETPQGAVRAVTPIRQSISAGMANAGNEHGPNPVLLAARPVVSRGRGGRRW